jgi:hypothetical protein
MTSLLTYRIREVNPAGHEFCNNAEIGATLHDLPPEEMPACALCTRQPVGKILSEYEILGVGHDRDMPPNPFRDAVHEAAGPKSRNVAP